MKDKEGGFTDKGTDKRMDRLTLLLNFFFGYFTNFLCKSGDETGGWMESLVSMHGDRDGRCWK